MFIYFFKKYKLLCIIRSLWFRVIKVGLGWVSGLGRLRPDDETSQPADGSRMRCREAHQKWPVAAGCFPHPILQNSRLVSKSGLLVDQLLAYLPLREGSLLVSVWFMMAGCKHGLNYLPVPSICPKGQLGPMEMESRLGHPLVEHVDATVF